MNETVIQKAPTPIIREYEIGDIAYIVKAVTKDGAKEDTETTICRLTSNDLKKARNHKSSASRLNAANRFKWNNL